MIELHHQQTGLKCRTVVSTYRRNSRGPKTEPCGTPAFISFGVDNFPEICTC